MFPVTNWRIWIKTTTTADPSTTLRSTLPKNARWWKWPKTPATFTPAEFTQCEQERKRRWRNYILASPGGWLSLIMSTERTSSWILIQHSRFFLQSLSHSFSANVTTPYSSKKSFSNRSEKVLKRDWRCTSTASLILTGRSMRLSVHHRTCAFSRIVMFRTYVGGCVDRFPLISQRKERERDRWSFKRHHESRNVISSPSRSQSRRRSCRWLKRWQIFSDLYEASS